MNSPVHAALRFETGNAAPHRHPAAPPPQPPLHPVRSDRTCHPARPGRAPAAGAPAGRPAGAPPLTLTERRALVRAHAARYARAAKREKTRILDEVCAATGWHRSHARRALLGAARPEPAGRPRAGRTTYDAEVVAALAFCWTILDMPAGKRLAPVLPELVPVLRRHGELALSDEAARLLTRMSAATVDRRLAPLRRPSGPVTRIRPGSRPRDGLPLLTWAEWDHTRPGFLEVTVVHHNGGTGGGEHLRTVSATDIATGWTENRTVRSAGHVPFALDGIAAVLPFPVLGVEAGDHGRGAADEPLLRWCREREVTFTLTRPGGHHHVGQRNWSTLHAVTGAYGYETTAELVLLNRIWRALSRLTNYFHPQQHAVSATGRGGRRRKEYDTATPFRRAERHAAVTAEDRAILADTYGRLNPAELHRRVRAMTSRLHLMAAGRAAHPRTAPRYARGPGEDTGVAS